MNIFGYDQVDLVVIGPDGQIKLDEVNNQKFTGITLIYRYIHKLLGRQLWQCG